VNIAAQISADCARSGAIVTQEVVAFTEIGPVELKGLSSPLRLHPARLRT
jgi:hypothetical protein